MFYTIDKNSREDMFCRRISLMMEKRNYKGARALLEAGTNNGTISEKQYSLYDKKLSKIEEKERGLVLKTANSN